MFSLGFVSFHFYFYFYSDTAQRYDNTSEFILTTVLEDTYETKLGKCTHYDDNSNTSGSDDNFCKIFVDKLATVALNAATCKGATIFRVVQLVKLKLDTVCCCSPF